MVTRLLQLSLVVFALSFAGLTGCQDPNASGDKGGKKGGGGLGALCG